ncbi:MAG: hypothetical protein FJ253_05905, partial [Phycisphaerae bacterium]|nr:hypothetical protein [Phycisphaerae bacterium]
FLCASIARVVLVLVGAPLLLFAGTPLLDSIVAALILLFLWRRDASRAGAAAASMTWRSDRRLMGALIRSSIPIAISGFAVVAIMQLDRMMLESLSGPEAAGIYTAAAMLSGAWYAIPVIIGASVAPTLTELFDHDRAGYRKRLSQVHGAVCGAAIAVGLLLLLLSRPLISLFFGERFADAAPVLAIHGWTGVFVAHVSIRTRAMMIEGEEHRILFFSLLTLGAVVALNALLIPRYGAEGAAWASLASWALNAAAWPLLLRSTRHHAFVLVRSFNPAAWFAVLSKGST